MAKATKKRTGKTAVAHDLKDVFRQTGFLSHLASISWVESLRLGGQNAVEAVLWARLALDADHLAYLTAKASQTPASTT